ncbi:hypothetical protein M6B38_191660 [Iris pallida]|uniref:Uncharacterized protein n=1 Tax=Iris pallida TaxID=29817 RepID=A0AAX6EFW1_IRIPA|nr:hypothetical protein M6B38_191660 [Iris pallida]
MLRVAPPKGSASPITYLRGSGVESCSTEGVGEPIFSFIIYISFL